MTAPLMGDPLFLPAGTADELIGLKASEGDDQTPNLAIQKRMRLIEQLPPAKRRVILQTIDAFVKGVQ